MIRLFDVNVPGRNYAEYATVFKKDSIYSNYNLNGPFQRYQSEVL
jgi:hypothetical protein